MKTKMKYYSSASAAVHYLHIPTIREFITAYAALWELAYLVSNNPFFTKKLIANLSLLSGQMVSRVPFGNATNSNLFTQDPPCYLHRIESYLFLMYSFDKKCIPKCVQQTPDQYINSSGLAYKAKF